MNAERLHAIAVALRQDISATESDTLVSQLAQQLHAQVQSPADPNAQVQAATTRDQLNTNLAGAPSNDFSPAWSQAAEELGVDDLLGDKLRARIEDILGRNEITVESAANELDQIGQRLRDFVTALDQLISAMNFLEVGAETLDPGQFEIGFLFPRKAVDNELAQLGRELVKLHDIVDPFLELGTGSRPDLKVRSVSTSWFQVYLDSPGTTAAAFALAVERIVALYKNLLDIRVAQKTLDDAHAPDAVTAAVTDWTSGLMADGIDEIVEELLEEFGQDIEEGRKHELREALKHALNGMANRVDRGYNLEVRAGELPEPEEDEPEDEDAKRARAVADAIAAKRNALQFMNLTGKPILQLPEGDDDQPADDGDQPADDGDQASGDEPTSPSRPDASR
jgi:hypothetical protein